MIQITFTQNIIILVSVLILELLLIWYQYANGQSIISNYYLKYNIKYGSKIIKYYLLLKSLLPHGFSFVHLLLLNIGLIGISYNLNTFFKINIILSFLLILFIEVLSIFITKQKELNDANIDEDFSKSLYYFSRTYKVTIDLKEAIIKTLEYSKSLKSKYIFEDSLFYLNSGLSALESIEKAFNKHKSHKIKLALNLIKVNRESGINLTLILDKLAEITKINVKNQKEAKNILMQTKISTIITSLMVPVVVIGLLLISKNYFDVLLNSNTGRITLTICFLWYLIGVYIVNKTLKDISLKI